jgi:UPF0042 nucleotide-binding protein
LKGEKKDLEVVIITGLSGAGRTEAVRCFEDMGYFCVDNLPPSFFLNLVELFSLPGSNVKKVAVVSDVRGKEYFPQLFQVLNELKERGIKHQILFLDASDKALVKRFKETRRRHPLAEEGEIIEGITKERKMLEKLKGMADMIIDTSNLAIYELRDKIRTAFLGPEKERALRITVMSFGYKYGVPIDADIVMDVRFLPNPHYEPSLRSHTGKEVKVKKFVLDSSEAQKFLKDFENLLSFLLPNYVKEGKSHLLIALGCTGGTHRSVALAEEIASFLRKKGYFVAVHHRDVEKEEE